MRCTFLTERNWDRQSERTSHPARKQPSRYLLKVKTSTGGRPTQRPVKAEENTTASAKVNTEENMEVSAEVNTEENMEVNTEENMEVSAKVNIIDKSKNSPQHRTGG